MKKKIRLGCPNKECKNYKKNEKFKSAVAECPECGSKLVHICKSKKCRTVVDGDDEAFCVLCKAEREDRKAAAGKGVAIGGAGLFGIGVKYRRQLLGVVKTIPELLLKK